MNEQTTLSNDPCERILQEAFIETGINYLDRDATYPHLDFYLPDLDLYIEVKQMHSNRIADQMSRVPNVIAIQGKAACYAFAALLRAGGAR